MEMQRKWQIEAASGGTDHARVMTSVDLPVPYEGVGKALRKSFSATRRDVPDDMLALLAELDRH